MATLELNIEGPNSVSRLFTSLSGQIRGTETATFALTLFTEGPILPAWLMFNCTLLNKQLLLCWNNTAVAA